MPTHRWAFFLTIAIGLPTVLTFFSLLHTHPRGDYAPEGDSQSGIGAFFSFHTPSSLFPPSAIISLTDDNSTFFLARPADFGPSLQPNGLSGQLWIGSGFGEDDSGRSGVGAGTEGELGCSDVPGWNEAYAASTASGKDISRNNNAKANAGTSTADGKASKLPQSDSDQLKPQEEDGTDDHLHHPLPSSSVTKPINPTDSTRREIANSGHADIQSLQEGAEIAGKVVLLSRGGCGFLEKVKWAQRRGATALIVGDHTRGGALVTMYARGDTSNVTIPSVFTSHTTAHLLSSLLPPEDGSDDATNPDKKEGTPNSRAQEGDIKETRRTTKVTGGRRKRPSSKSQTLRAKAQQGWISSLKSAFGLGKHSRTAVLQSDTRRPPSSGRLDLSPDKQKSANAKDLKARTGTHKRVGEAATKEEARKPGSHQNDDFVIGVQDWRDPDLMVVKASRSTSTIKSTSEGPVPTDILNKGKEPGSEQTSTALTGGSITPGSGEYSKPGESDKNTGKGSKSDSKDAKGSTSSTSTTASTSKQDQPDLSEEHEGLWVTITLTTMSTSPFFDTLLVLVVSPLVTLTVVYALLLLRSRIRRRRWRAPKSVVERLPIRTYHTMSTSSSSSTASSTRYASPQTSLPTSPLLQSSPRSVSNHGRPRSATTTGVFEAVSVSLEKASPDASIARNEKTLPPKKRKSFHTKHVECVVCLEEYVDGHSRVMSLPCGHEFHAECITPWLTTRRRTCPICKGDVVRSMAQPSSASTHQNAEDSHNQDAVQTQAAETIDPSPTAAIPIPREAADLEQGDDMAATLVDDGEAEASSSRSPWAGLTSMSLGAFSGARGGKDSHRNR